MRQEQGQRQPADAQFTERKIRSSVVVDAKVSRDEGTKYAGDRETMHDRNVEVPYGFAGKPNRGFFAIFDGFGSSSNKIGSYVSDGAEKHFAGLLAKLMQDNPKTSIPTILRRAYLRFNEHVLEEKKRHSEPDAVDGVGSTAVTAVIDGRKLHVANAGDSPLLLIRGRRAETLTELHQTISGDKKPITKYLGIDSTGEKADPAVTTIALKPSDRYVVLACDGVVGDGALSPLDVAMILADDISAEEASGRLLTAAEQKGSTDNKTVTVIKLDVPRISRLKKITLAGVGAMGLATCIGGAGIAAGFIPSNEPQPAPRQPFYVVPAGEPKVIRAGIDCATVPGTTIDGADVPQPDGIAVIVRFERSGIIFHPERVTECLDSGDEAVQDLTQEIKEARPNIQYYTVLEVKPEDR